MAIDRLMASCEPEEGEAVREEKRLEGRHRCMAGKKAGTGDGEREVAEHDRGEGWKMCCKAGRRETMGEAEAGLRGGPGSEGTRMALYAGSGLVQRSKGRRLLADCELFVTCEPCVMCAAAVGLLGVDRVVFGTNIYPAHKPKTRNLESETLKVLLRIIR